MRRVERHHHRRGEVYAIRRIGDYSYRDNHNLSAVFV